MSLKLVTPPATEPVSLTLAKQWLRVDGDEENDLLELIIKTAREYCQDFQNRAYISQGWRLKLDAFPDRACGDGPIVLPMPPLMSVGSIQYVDTAGDTQTLSADDYRVLSDDEPARILPAYATSWPSTRDQAAAVMVNFTAGYGSASSDVPSRVVLAMQLLVAHWYEHREAVLTGTISKEIEFAVGALLSQDRIVPI